MTVRLSVFQQYMRLKSRVLAYFLFLEYRRAARSDSGGCLMATESKTGKTGGETEAASRAGTPEETLKPFQDASVKFLKASSSAQEQFMRQRAQACLDFQDQVRKVEQETYQAVADLTRRLLSATGQGGS